MAKREKTCCDNHPAGKGVQPSMPVISDPLVVFKDVSVVRSRRKILDNISFELGKGEIVLLIGLNGAGKSTLLKAILGLCPISSGKVELNTKKVGYVPQNLEFDRTIPLSVKELLATYSKASMARIKEKLEEVGAGNLIKKKVGVLSGGELQRVLIANALLQEPDLLLMDEAMAGVDVVGEHAFYELVEQIHRDYGMTIVMVSHDIHTVFAKADRVFCLNGHICCAGKPADVSKHPEFERLFCSHLAPYRHG